MQNEEYGDIGITYERDSLVTTHKENMFLFQICFQQKW